MVLSSLDPDLAEGSEPFICVICSHIVRKPLSIECSHLFCGECLRKWVDSKPIPKCPTCKASVDISRAVPNNFVRKMIENLKFRCPNVQSGCTFIKIGGVKLRNLKAHLVQCQFQSIPCTLCNDEVMKKDMEDHVNNDCVERNVKCKSCDAVTKFRLQSIHEKECEEMEVSCELCDVKVKRKALASHDKKSMVVHLRAMQNQIRDMKQREQQMQNTTQQLQLTTQQLESKTQQLETATQQLHNLEAVVLECGLEYGVYHRSTESKEEFTWYCKDYVKGDKKFEYWSNSLKMKAGYNFRISAQIVGEYVGVYVYLKGSDSVAWPFPFPYTVQALRPTFVSGEVNAAALRNPENVYSFGASPKWGIGVPNLLRVADLGDHPLLVRVIFHLDQKLAVSKKKKKRKVR